MTSKLEQLARAVVETYDAKMKGVEVKGKDMLDLRMHLLRRHLGAADQPRSTPELSEAERGTLNRFDRALESDAELELPSPRNSEAPGMEAWLPSPESTYGDIGTPCSGCDRPAGIAHAYGCPVLEQKP